MLSKEREKRVWIEVEERQEESQEKLGRVHCNHKIMRKTFSIKKWRGKQEVSRSEKQRLNKNPA